MLVEALSLSKGRNLLSRKCSLIALALLSLLSRPAFAMEAKWVGAWPFGYAEAMAIHKNALFVAMGGGVAIYDISRPRTPVRVGEIRTPGLIAQLAIQSEGGSQSSPVLYIAGRESGVWAYDVSTPDNPQELGGQGTPDSVTGIAVSNDLALANLGKSGVLVLDARRPNDLSIVGTLKAPAAARNIVIQGTTAFLADGETGLVIADLSIPGTPRVISTLKTRGAAQDIAVSGTYAYLAIGKSGVAVMDVSTLESPQIIATIPALGSAARVHIASNALAVVENEGVHFFDVSRPERPERIGSYPPPDSGRPPVAYSAVLVDGLFAYLLNEKTGVTVVDFSSPQQPVDVKTIVPDGAASSIAVQGTAAYLAGDSPVVHVFDLSQMTDPSEVKTLTLPRPAASVAVVGNLLFVPLYEDGLRIYDLKKPLDPKSLTQFQPQTAPGEVPGRITGVAVLDNYAYLAVEPPDTSGHGPGGFITSTLLTLDITNPRAPTPVGSATFTGRVASGQALAVLHDRLYVAAGDEGLHVFLLDDPANPVEIGSYSAHPAVAVAVTGDFAYLAAGRDGFIALNVADPEEIRQMGYIDTLDCRGKGAVRKCVGSAQGLAITGNLVVLANAEAGVRVAHISDPAHPRVIGPFPTAGSATAIALSGGIACVADGAGGLRLLQFSE
ncbi:MAG: LVIVD repeat-containing protein [bacterium]